MNNLALRQVSPKTLKIIVATVIVGILMLIGWYVWGNNTDSQPNSSLRTSGKYTLFEGTITAIDRACELDAECSVTVGDKVVITGQGLEPTPESNIFGTTDADLVIGDIVEVKAIKSNDIFTLQQCPECYVKQASGKARSSTPSSAELQTCLRQASDSEANSAIIRQAQQDCYDKYR